MSTFRRRHSLRPIWLVVSGFITLLTLPLPALADHIIPFIGTYTGSADIVSADGTKSLRDMGVNIVEADEGFTVQWMTTTHKPDGRRKEKSYSIDFVSTDRHSIYSAAMKRNVFGHEVQMDPMKGEPFVWARIVGETLSVFSLFVDDEGGWEMQEYDRTLTEGGLTLDFRLIRDGEPQRSVTTFLERQ